MHTYSSLQEDADCNRPSFVCRTDTRISVSVLKYTIVRAGLSDFRMIDRIKNNCCKVIGGTQTVGKGNGSINRIETIVSKTSVVPNKSLKAVALSTE